jgi:Smg protein
MFDILAYLYENCHQTDLSDDGELIAKKLSAAGFDDSDISEALTWLAGVLHAPRIVAQLPGGARALRTFAPKEIAKLEPECRGFIMHLENIEVLDASLRELVIDRAMATSTRTLSLEQLKIIVLMVLWNRELPAGRLIAEELLSGQEERLAN